MSIKEFVPQTLAVPCDFCKSSQMLLFERKMRHGLNLETKICANCLLVQTNPQPTPACLNDFYSNYYHQFHKRTGVDDGYIRKSKKMAGRRFELITEFIKRDYNTIALEIGTGAGQFMLEVKQKSSWSIEGIEPGTESYQWCKSLGLSVTHVGIEEYRPTQKFNLITSFHVLEHVISPQKFLSSCSAMMEEGGVLYLEVPNFNSPGFAYNQFLQFPHLYNFTLHTLTNYLQDASFQLIYVEEAVSNLTVIAKKISGYKGIPIRIGKARYLNKLKWKKKIYRYAAYIPQWPFIGKIRSLIFTIC